MKKLATLALILALGACKSSGDAKATKTESQESAGEPGATPGGRSGKIDLALKPGATDPNTVGRPDRVDRSKQFDTDGDGVLSDAERQAMRDARRAKVMERLDTDGDGKISDAEREAAQVEREAARAEREAERLKRQDTDGDGKVSDAERAAAAAERTKSMYARLDADGDGKLTTQELAAGQRGGRDVSKVDTNGDGVISTEELQKSLDEGRRGFRGVDRGGAPGSYHPQ